MAKVILDEKRAYDSIEVFRNAIGMSYEEFAGAKKVKEGDKYYIYTRDLVGRKSRKVREKDKSKWGKSVVDHKGMEFKNTRTLCIFYGISQATYSRKLNRGESIGEILYGKDGGTKYEAKKYSPVEFGGVKYRNKSDMCRAYGVLLATYNYRKKKGCTDEEALTQEYYKRRKSNSEDGAEERGDK
jgi:hypothetical protein